MDADAGEYIKGLRLLQRKFSFLAKSIDLKLKIILAKMELDPPKTLEEKIDMFLKTQPEMEGNFSGDLTEKLHQFNRYWMAIDQGSEAAGEQAPAVCSEGEILTFERSKQAEIDDDFMQIMAALTEISDNLMSNC